MTPQLAQRPNWLDVVSMGRKRELYPNRHLTGNEADRLNKRPATLPLMAGVGSNLRLLGFDGHRQRGQSP